MSDLWAQVNLTLTGNFSTLANGAPVNDMANVVEAIGGQTYLLSLSTGITWDSITGPAVYGNGQGATALNSITTSQTFPQNVYYPWHPYVTVTQVPTSYDVSALNDVPATTDNPGGFPNSVGALFTGTVPAGTDAITTLLTISGVSQTIVVPNGIVASSYIPNFYAPALSASETWSDPNTSSGVQRYTQDATVYYPEYVWVDLGPAPSGTLFTTGADTVDFNNLTSDQQAAIAGGADLYHGHGGDDVVTLPSVANYNESLGSAGGTLVWNPSQTFYTGSQAGDTYTVNGSDGSYNIALGAGSDTVTINGNGTSNITVGTGSDTITIEGTGTNTLTVGSGTVTLADWSGTLSIQNGSTVSAPIFVIDDQSASNSSATFDHTTLSISGSLAVGIQGKGTLGLNNRL
jgi:hypothetical protein